MRIKDHTDMVRHLTDPFNIPEARRMIQENPALTQEQFKAGGIVEPGVTHYGVEAGGYATSALQKKVTSKARNNVDNFVKTWVKNNIDTFKANQSDDFLKTMTNALKEDVKNFPAKYDTGNFQFNPITKNNLPNVSTFQKGKGFKLFDVSYSVSNTNRIPAMFNKLFFKGKLATDKNLVRDVNNFMEFIVKHKTYGEGGPIAVGKRNAKTLADLSKPEVMSIMEGLGSKAKKEVLENLNPELYSKYQKKVLGQLQNYKEDLKGLEKIVGQKEGTAWSKMTKDRKAVEKIIGIGGDFAPSVEHMFGISFAKNSKDPKIIRAALDSVTMIPRKENIGKGFGYYGFDQTRNRLIESYNTAKVSGEQRGILNELKSLAKKWDAPIKFSTSKGALKITPTQSHQSIYKQAKNYVGKLIDDPSFFKSEEFKKLPVEKQKDFLTMKKNRDQIGPVLKTYFRCASSKGGNCPVEGYRKSFNEVVERAAAGDKAAVSKLQKFTKAMKKIKGPLKWTGYGLLGEIGFMVPFGVADYTGGKSWKRIMGNASDWGFGPMFGQSEDEEIIANLPEGSLGAEGQEALAASERLKALEDPNRNFPKGRIGMDPQRFQKAQAKVISDAALDLKNKLTPFMEGPRNQYLNIDKADQSMRDWAAAQELIKAQEARRVQERRDRGFIAEEGWEKNFRRNRMGGGIMSLKK